MEHAIASCKKSGGRELNLSGMGLTLLPQECFDFVESLEILNLGGNHISSLPADFDRFQRLRVLFFAGNSFIYVPKVLGRMKSLYMLSFKGNRLEQVDEEALSPSIGWLILTDNRISKIPRSIGCLKGLRKCMLAGNALQSLPDEMKKCRELELLRLAANDLKEVPRWLLEMPKLSWLALAGNPCLPSVTKESYKVETIDEDRLETAKTLGEGASGVVFEGTLDRVHSVAVKVFKGEATSDGLPQDEMLATVHLGCSDDPHPCITPVLGKVSNPSNATDSLVFELIPPNYLSLGDPPSFKTVTRDTFAEGTTFHPTRIAAIAREVAGACVYMHQTKAGVAICHGDLYAHNILVTTADEAALDSVQVRLCDMGAATIYDPAHPSGLGALLQRLEVRAFGCLLDDLLRLVPDRLTKERAAGSLVDQLGSLRDLCMAPNVAKRPPFTAVFSELEKLCHTKGGGLLRLMDGPSARIALGVVVLGCLCDIFLRRK